MYVQETGRGGRDNVLSNAILYYNKQDIAANSHVTMWPKRSSDTVKASECRALLRQFTDEALDLPLHRHLCCDVCASVCLCEDCNFSVNSPADDSNACTCTSPVLSINQDSNAGDAPETIQATLEEQLLSYHK